MTAIRCLVPSHNAGRWIDRALDSLAAQTRSADQVLVLDDASTDQVYETLGERCAAQGWGLHRNPERLRCPHNLRVGIELLAPADDDVIFLLDGDDFLPPHALERIDAVYAADPGLWLTWGGYESWPDPTFMPAPAQPYPPEVVAARSYRQHTKYVFNHPITFRAHLWSHVTDAELQDSEGRWFPAAYDFAIMAPMLELASSGHHRCLDEVLYFYNQANPASEAVIYSAEGGRVDTIIKHRTPREPLGP